MMTVKRVLLKHPWIFLYFLVLVIVLVLFARELQPDEADFSLERSFASAASQYSLLSVYGEGLHADLKGVLVKLLTNEKALLWAEQSLAPSRALDIKDGLALVACYGKKLVSLDLRGDKSRLLSSVEFPASIGEVKIVADKALVGLQRYAGLFVVDLKNPDKLKTLKHYPLDGSVTDMAVGQKMAYFSDLYQGVGRVDFSTEIPIMREMVPVPSPWKIALRGNRMAVCTLKGKVFLFDVSPDGSLVESGQFDYPDAVRDVALTEEVLAVALADGTMSLYALAAWPKLSEYAQFKLPGRPMSLDNIPGRESVAVGLVSDGVALFDINRPGLPELYGHLRVSRNFSAMKLSSDKMFVVGYRRGLEVFSLHEIAKGDQALQATKAMLKEKYMQLHSWNGFAYGYHDKKVTSFGGRPAKGTFKERSLAIVDAEGIAVFEQGEGGQVLQVGPLLKLAGIRAAKFRGGYLYVIHRNRLSIFSGRWPDEMVVVGELALHGDPGDFEVLDSGHLVASDGSGGLLNVDVKDPSRPVEIANFKPPLLSQPVPAYKQKVLIVGSRAYVSQGAAGVLVVDVSVPEKLKLLQIIDTPGYARDMAIYGDLLLIVDSLEGIFMVDISDLEGALPIGSFPVPLSIDLIAVANDGLIVSRKDGATMKLPLPQQLKGGELVGNNEMRFSVKEVASGQNVYLYDDKVSRQVGVSVQ